MYNVNTGMVPSYIQYLIPPLVSEVSDYPLRNTRNIIEQVFHKNLVFHHQLDYGTPLQMI